MKLALVKDLYCGYGELLTTKEKAELIKLTLKVFEFTPINQRPKPSALVVMVLTSRNNLTKPKH